MSNAEQYLKRIQEKVQDLLKMQSALQKENARLKADLEEANAKLAAQYNAADELRQQVSVLKLNAGSMSEKDKKEFEKKINGYLKEIDKCIALLSE